MIGSSKTHGPSLVMSGGAVLTRDLFPINVLRVVINVIFRKIVSNNDSFIFEDYINILTLENI